MIPLVLPLINNAVRYKNLVLGLFAIVAIFGAYFYIAFLHTKNSELNKQTQQLELQLNTTNAQLANIKLQYQQNLEALTQLEAQREQREQQISNLKRRTKNVKEIDDGSIAPVLSDVLNGLRKYQTSSNGM